MVLKVAALLFLCLAELTHGVRDLDFGRSLLNSTSEIVSDSEVSSRRGGGTSVVTAGGSATAGKGETTTVVITATAKAAAEEKDALAMAIAEAVNEVQGGADAGALATTEGKAYAEAVAEAYTKVTVDVQTTSEGEPSEAQNTFCAEASAQASSTATAFATVLVEVLTEASDMINFADATGAATAISGATAEAFSQSEVEVCGQGEAEVTMSREDLAVAISEPYSTVILGALNTVGEQGSSGKIVVETDGGTLETTTTDTQTTSVLNGDVDGRVGGGAVAMTTELNGADAVDDPDDADASNGADVGEETCNRAHFRNCCDDEEDNCTCGTSFSDCEAMKINVSGMVGYEVVATSSLLGPQVGERCVCA